MPIASINPCTEELFREFDALSGEALEEKLAKAWQTFHEWKKSSFAQRAEALLRAAEILEKEKAAIGALAVAEMGKTLVSAIAEAEKCALGCRYYAANGERLLLDQDISTNASRSFIKYQPLGPILAVMPWNFPFWQVFRFAAPALMAGNVALLKHSSNVPQCALAIEDILRRAGFPEGAFQTLLIEADRVAALLEDDRIAAATLTGSEPAGRSVAKVCGSQIKKTVLELGGSDPFIVMPSAAGADTVAAAVRARTINNGQSCIAAKRFIIADSIYDDFVTHFVEGMKALRIGDPALPETEIGPLATAKILEETQLQVDKAVAAGATILAGGRRLKRPGYFFEPTVLAGVPRGSDIFYEEFFGPVALLFRVSSAAEAIDLANDSPFGLGASVWTREEAEQRQFIDGIETGQVYVNATVASDPRLPFGGVKRSGYGRELSELGIREFTNVKTVWVK
jgi:succinate-semialdehyde dehydrogenase / glutarate-semialdehyde dehydrogenase